MAQSTIAATNRLEKSYRELLVAIDAERRKCVLQWSVPFSDEMLNAVRHFVDDFRRADESHEIERRVSLIELLHGDGTPYDEAACRACSCEPESAAHESMVDDVARETLNVLDELASQHSHGCELLLHLYRISQGLALDGADAKWGDRLDQQSLGALRAASGALITWLSQAPGAADSAPAEVSAVRKKLERLGYPQIDEWSYRGPLEEDVPVEFRDFEQPTGDLLVPETKKRRTPYHLKPSDFSRGLGKEFTVRLKVGRSFAYLFKEVIAAVSKKSNRAETNCRGAASESRRSLRRTI
jgi:hypothetical protein